MKLEVSQSTGVVKSFNLKILLVAILFFFLPCANSYPGRAYYFLTNLQGYSDLSFSDQSIINLLLLPSIIIPILIFIIRLVNGERILLVVGAYTQLCLLAFFLFFSAGTLSLMANYSTPGVLTTYISGILAPFCIALAFTNLKLNRSQFHVVMIALSVGCMFPLILGLYAYFSSWGIPDLSTLIMSHFNLGKMRSYSIQTLGNADNTAAFMGMIGVVFFCLILTKNNSAVKFILYSLVLALSVIHLLILQIRVALIFFLLMSLIISFISNKRFFYLYLLTLIAVVVSLYIYSPKSLGLLSNRMILAITWSNEGADVSAGARLHSMSIGWRIFMQNFLLGVGPEASKHYIVYGTAHQFNIQRGVELGILGFLASILISGLAIWRFFRLSWIYFRQRDNWLNITLSAAPAFYFLCSLFSNMPLTLGVTNTWIGLVACLMFLSASSELL